MNKNHGLVQITTIPCHNVFYGIFCVFQMSSVMSNHPCTNFNISNILCGHERVVYAVCFSIFLQGVSGQYSKESVYALFIYEAHSRISYIGSKLYCSQSIILGFSECINKISFVRVRFLSDIKLWLLFVLDQIIFTNTATTHIPHHQSIIYISGRMIKKTNINEKGFPMLNVYNYNKNKLVWHRNLLLSPLYGWYYLLLYEVISVPRRHWTKLELSHM